MDFDISNMPICEFWVTIGDRLFFFHSAIEQYYFFSQNQSKEIFSPKNPSPPPEYQMDRALFKKEREGAVVFLLIYETEFLYRQTNFSPIDMNIFTRTDFVVTRNKKNYSLMCSSCEKPTGNSKVF